jgi:hypothetical protein
MALLDKKPDSSTRSGKDRGIETPADSDGAAPAGTGQAMQGEGNYQAAREFNAAEHKFVASGKVPAAALAAAPHSDAERREMADAEDQGKQRAKGVQGVPGIQGVQGVQGERGKDEHGAEKADKHAPAHVGRSSSTLRMPAKHAERKPG